MYNVEIRQQEPMWDKFHMGFYFIQKRSVKIYGMKKQDIYETWKSTGQLDKVMAFIKSCATGLITQKEMCEYLNITEQSFTNMKKKHPEIAKVMEDAKLDLKSKLIDALVKKALGFEIVEEEQFIEDGGKGEKQKRKIHRTKKQVPPDYKSIVYLLTKKFGKEFSERYEDIMLAEKKLEQAKEVWNNEQQVETSANED